MECDHATRRDRNFFTGLGIASWTLRFVTQLEIAESRQLDSAAVLQRRPDLLEKRFDHVLGFTLIETHFLKQEVSEFCLG
jgi:hypothetical protein